MTQDEKHTARYAVLENELYVAVKVSDIDKLIFTDGKVVELTTTQETQNDGKNGSVQSQG